MTIPKFRFYLLGLKGYQVLKKVLDKYGSDFIENIFLSYDKNVEEDYCDKIKNLCEANNVIWKMKNDNFTSTTFYSFAIGWRWIIDLKRVSNLIILHDSILPKYRGFNPLVSALINGENQIGVSALFASSKYDQGDIICQSVKKIEYPIKIKDAIDLISNSYSDLVLQIIELVVNGKDLPRKPQNNKESTYSLWRDEEDYHIDWSWDSKKIIRFINATGFPYLGAKTFIEEESIRITEAIEVQDVKIENRSPGKVIFFENNYPIVVCGKGLIKIIEMKRDTDKSDYILKRFRTRFQ